MSQLEHACCSRGQHVTVTTLEKPGAKLPGEVLSLSGSALHLLVDTPLEIGAAVKAEYHDMLMLGEVSRCQPSNGHYSVDLKLEHSLLHTAQLARLARRLLGEAPRGTPRGNRRAGERLSRRAKS